MYLEKDQIKVDLSLVSGIMNYAGYKGLLNYLALETYKKVVRDEYVNYSNFAQYSFLTGSQWVKFMDKLVDMRVAVKNGTSYITRTKLKNWRDFALDNQKASLKLNGYLIFNMSEFYKSRELPDIKDRIFLSIVRAVTRGKSMSRGFIKSLTGISATSQRKIESRQQGTLLETNEQHIPVGDMEYKDGKVGDIPVFNGYVHPKSMTCNKTNKVKSNCKVIQLGNRLTIKDLHLIEFAWKKTRFNKSKSNLDQLNESPKGNEVQSWDDLNMVIDTSEGSNSNKFRGVLSVNDKRYTSWKDFEHYDYENVKVLDENGNIADLRDILNK